MEKERRGLSLLDKSKKGLIRTVFSRTGLVTCLLLLNFGLLSLLGWKFTEFVPQIFGSTAVFTVIMVLVLLNSQHDPTAKLTWLVIIMAAPVFGSLLYLYTRSDIGHRALKKRSRAVIQATQKLVEQDPQTKLALRQQDEGAANLARYLRRMTDFPAYRNTDATYFPSGETMFAQLLQELEQAKEFIFLEYFIVEEGAMWGQILEILARKAGEGVEIRLLYDGTCEFMLLPRDYPEKLKRLG